MLFIQALKKITIGVAGTYAWVKLLQSQPKPVITELSTIPPCSTASCVQYAAVSPVVTSPPVFSSSVPSSLPLVDSPVVLPSPSALASFSSQYDGLVIYATTALSIILLSRMLMYLLPSLFPILLEHLIIWSEIIANDSPNFHIKLLAAFSWFVLYSLQDHLNKQRDAAVLKWSNVHDKKSYDRRLKALSRSQYRVARPVSFGGSSNHRAYSHHIRCHRMLQLGKQVLNTKSRQITDLKVEILECYDRREGLVNELKETKKSHESVSNLVKSSQKTAQDSFDHTAQLRVEKAELQAEQDNLHRRTKRFQQIITTREQEAERLKDQVKELKARYVPTLITL